MKHLKLFESYNELDRLIEIRMDKIFDTVEDYKEQGIDCEIKDIDFDSYKEFNEKHLLDIVDFINDINNTGKILMCDFPSFVVSTMDDLEEGNIDLGELEIYETKINIEYKYTHVYTPFKPKTHKFELEDRFMVRYEGTTDEISSKDILELMTNGAHHSEYGIIGTNVEAIKEYIKINFGG
jgi:hypothetical protein